jgi:hypothetical protein
MPIESILLLGLLLLLPLLEQLVTLVRGRDRRGQAPPAVPPRVQVPPAPPVAVRPPLEGPPPLPPVVAEAAGERRIEPASSSTRPGMRERRPRSSERPAPRLAAEVLAARRPSAKPAPAPRRARPRRGVRDLRRAMVWMAVLGPCRGQEPYRFD